MLLHAYVVGIVEVVDAHDGVAIGQQELGHAGPDETGCAGEEDVHARILITPAAGAAKRTASLIDGKPYDDEAQAAFRPIH